MYQELQQYVSCVESDQKVRKMIKIKCDACGHRWTTKSEHIFVSCPSCLKKVRIKKTGDKNREVSGT